MEISSLSTYIGKNVPTLADYGRFLLDFYSPALFLYTSTLTKHVPIGVLKILGVF